MKRYTLISILLLTALSAGATKRTLPEDNFRSIANAHASAAVKKFCLYPEPGTGNVLVVHPNAKNATVIFKDNSGKDVKTYELKEGVNSTTINCKDLLPGNYEAIWKNGSHTQTTRLTIEVLEP